MKHLSLSTFTTFFILFSHTAGSFSTSDAEPIRENKKEIVIAIIDTGIDTSHPMLKKHLWKNSDPSSKKIHGWNFLDDSPNINDEHGHGTHISGIIVQNLLPHSNIKLMVLKYYKTKALETETLEASNKALEFAINMGVDIINYSGGGNFPNPRERALFKKANDKKIFVVAAAGNDGRTTNTQGFFPASYGFDHIISVASTNQNGDLLTSSNRGVESVDIASYGEDILSSLPHSRMGRLTGTSQATAQVTGVLATLMETYPNFETVEIKKRLFQTALTRKRLKGLVKNPKIPHLKRAIMMKDFNDFNDEYRLAKSRVNEVFDNPIDEPDYPDRSLSSQQ